MVVHFEDDKTSPGTSAGPPVLEGRKVDTYGLVHYLGVERHHPEGGFFNGSMVCGYGSMVKITCDSFRTLDAQQKSTNHHNINHHKRINRHITYVSLHHKTNNVHSQQQKDTTDTELCV